MRISLYETVEDMELSLSSGTQKDFSFRSSIKELEFDFAILKYKKIDSLTEVVVEREKFKGLNFSNKFSISSEVKILDPQQERMEVHVIIRSDSYFGKRFCFNLGSSWEYGGRFYLRGIWD
jgi:hypothetical protein